MAGMYMRIKDHSNEQLHLVREPSLKAWSIFVGLVSFGLGAAIYSPDYWVWKICYVLATVFVGASFFEEWEEAIFDKTTGKVQLRKQTISQKFFQGPISKDVVCSLDDVIGVRVQQEEVKYAGDGHIVALYFREGYSIGITETAIIDGEGNYDEIADKIRRFLDLPNDFDSAMWETRNSPPAKNGENDSNESSTEESFEQIDEEDLEGSDIPLAQ